MFSLSEIVDKKVDNDHDGFVGLEEMQAWLKNNTRNAIMKEVESRWDLLSKIQSLDDYVSTYYGALDHCSYLYLL